ncbi:hypothetical protein Nepgr_020993 [Nepenthes gracilis]|uniref:Uncharacterized protein n=1 Tax=Nepenthes gracilis TaxID=150966 RepID=A0AAD3XVK1_NEPGR|nr:hypothetical protein Nepgr_020993 [Nepenthes gracilis]
MAIAFLPLSWYLIWWNVLVIADWSAYYSLDLFWFVADAELSKSPVRSTLLQVADLRTESEVRYLSGRQILPFKAGDEWSGVGEEE